ncbi:MAG TPA: helix-turn-helix transcriptional regulator [Solirubrobacterales bacterium]|nr:helix-turn-helix transcriptional regulator [Solirubrobacterales bacterium]
MDSPLAVRFGRNLWRQRRRADLSQRELADLTGLHRVDIGAIERGERLPRIDTILKVSAGVEASPCELMAGLRWYPGRYIEGEFYVEERSAPSSASGEWKAGRA